MTPRILIPFCDDSTLFFALRMRALLAPVQVTLAQLTGLATLSARQLAQHLPNGPDLTLPGAAIGQPAALQNHDAIITARMFPALQAMAATPRQSRPCIVSFQGGLDFTPQRGFAHRRDADAVFIVPKPLIRDYSDYRTQVHAGPQYVDFGHPAFLLPLPLQPPLRTSPPINRGDIWFFAQAISPLTRPARLHLLQILAALARRNPARDVWIKLRHLPGENRDHLHREQHDYPGLLSGLPDAPANLRLTACPMDQAIDQALAQGAIGITCTSTAAADLIQAGVPTQIYLDYVENYLDPLVPPMRHLFGGSGLVVSLPELLAGTWRRPDPVWLSEMFCTRDLGPRVLAAIATCQNTI